MRKRGMAITDRDLDVWSFLGEYGLLDSRQIQEEFWAEKRLRACQMRLQRYEEHGIVQAITLTMAGYHRKNRNGDTSGGRLPLIYALTPEGANILEQETGIRAKRFMRSELKSMTILHRREVVRVRLALDRACSRQKSNSNSRPIRQLMWIHEEDRKPDATGNLVTDRILYHPFTQRNEKFSYRPDLFGLTEIPRAAGGSHICVCYYEIDRGTMSHSQLSEKLRGITATIKTQAWKKYVPNYGQFAKKTIVRVFWVTSSPERADNIRQTFNDKSLITSAFRYTSQTQLTEHTALGPIWMDSNGEQRGMVIEPQSVSGQG